MTDEYSYGLNAGQHALTGIEDPGVLMNLRGQAIDYNAFNKAVWLQSSKIREV